MAEIQDANVQENTTPTNPEPETKPDNNNDPTEPATVDNGAEVAKLKAELARQINKNDALAKENANYKKEIRASKSAEEQRAEEERERQEAIENELKTLRKEASVSRISKSIMSFIGDEATATEIADHLYGANDVDAAIDALSKAWSAKEKKLKIEYGKIPAPESGDGAPTITKQEFSNMTYLQRLEIAKKYPETYKKLTT